MRTAYRFVANSYRDSVSLMQFSSRMKNLDGVVEVSAVMATRANMSLLKESGTWTQEISPRPDDLLVLVIAEDSSDVDALLDRVVQELDQKAATNSKENISVQRAVSIGKTTLPRRAGDWVLISVPGDYAAAEALKALTFGLNVMMFSDNVSVEREIELKRFAVQKELLFLGPDCGTSIVDGVPMGFANRVRRGSIGLIGASGTGLQEITSLIHVAGAGISQAYGVGGRDLKQEIGALSTLACFDRMEKDPMTQVLIVVSKPPSAAVRKLVEERALRLSIPVVFCFVGEAGESSRSNLHFASTMEQSAYRACSLAGIEVPFVSNRSVHSVEIALKPGQLVRGIYSGGTLCAEVASLFVRAGVEVFSNVKVPGAKALSDVWKSEGNCVVDLGEDEFTRGKPHPMIDSSTRLNRMAQEAIDPRVATIFFDVVLGYGSNPDPAIEIVEAIEAIRKTRPDLRFFAVVVGTDEDPQSLRKQTMVLERAEVNVFPSHARLVEALLSSLPVSSDL